jgi:hypothetical protein
VPRGRWGANDPGESAGYCRVPRFASVPRADASADDQCHRGLTLIPHATAVTLGGPGKGEEWDTATRPFDAPHLLRTEDAGTRSRRHRASGDIGSLSVGSLRPSFRLNTAAKNQTIATTMPT